MPSWEGKSKGSKLGYGIFVVTLRYGGVMPAYVVLRIAAFYYFLFSYSSSRPIYYYFHKRIGFGRWKSIISIYRSYYIFGQTLIDKVVAMSGIPNKFTFEFEGEKYLREITAAGKGGIMLSAHLGNWEIAGHLFKRLQTRINVVMFDNEHENIKQYLTSVTGERNVNVIVIKNDLSHIYAINDALSKQELVCMHADRFLDGNKVAAVPFLGENAHFPAGPFLLATTFRVPVSMVFACKESSTHYHLFATEPKEYFVHRRAGAEMAMNDFVQQLEIMVRKYPVQWFNYYDFWKSAR
jgi:predicted LPLAT superfamily acyltransferase